MARKPNQDNWQAGWNYIAAGGSLHTSGLSPVIAPKLKRLIDAGWTWGKVVDRLGQGATLVTMLAELEGVEFIPRDRPPAPLVPPKPKPPKPPPVEVIVHDGGGMARNPPRTVAAKVEARKRAWTETRALEEKMCLEQLDWVQQAFESARPFLATKTKRTEVKGKCEVCGGETTVEQIDIHPLRADVVALVKMGDTLFNRLRLNRGLPQKTESLKLKPQELVLLKERIEGAFRAQFEEAVESGELSEEVAKKLWDGVKRKLKGERE